MSKIGDLVKFEDIADPTYDVREIKRGEIYYIDLEDIGYGSRFVQTKTRPGLIIQNDTGNLHAATVIVALLTTSLKKDYPFQYRFTLNGRQSVIMFEQIMTIDKFRVLEKVGVLDKDQLREADKRLMHSLQLDRFSMENILDFEVDSVISKRTKTGEEIYFEISVYFEHGQKEDLRVLLDSMREYDDTITRDIGLMELKEKFNCCKGLHWLFSHCDY